MKFLLLLFFHFDTTHRGTSTRSIQQSAANDEHPSGIFQRQRQHDRYASQTALIDTKASHSAPADRHTRKQDAPRQLVLAQTKDTNCSYSTEISQWITISCRGDLFNTRMQTNHITDNRLFWQTFGHRKIRTPVIQRGQATWWQTRSSPFPSDNEQKAKASSTCSDRPTDDYRRL